MDADAALELVNRIYRRLNHRRPVIDRREQYYRGEQPLSFATEEWKRANATRYSGFADNWTAPVVNAEAERIRYTGLIVPGNEGVGKSLWEDWQRNDMDAQMAQGIVTTLTTSRSFVLVWGDPRTDEATITWEHPSNVEIEYDWEFGTQCRVAALKTWVDDEHEYATLYEPEAVWKFQRGRVVPLNSYDSQAVQARTGNTFDGGWQPRTKTGDNTWPIANPLGVVPIVEVQNRPPLKGDPVSEIQGVIPMQDAINLLWAYLLLAADYASMPARVLFGEPPMIPILDGDGNVVGKKPVEMKDLAEKRLLTVSGEHASIDSWDAAKLDVFTDTIDVAVGHISSQTRTPPTYLVTKVGMSNVAADGIEATETPLNNKVEEFWKFGKKSLRDMNQLIALARGDKALADVVRLGEVQYMKPATRVDSVLGDTIVKLKTAGFPFEYLAKVWGVDPSDIADLVEEKQEEDQAAMGFAVQGLIDGQQGEPVTPPAAGSDGVAA